MYQSVAIHSAENMFVVFSLFNNLVLTDMFLK